MWKSKEFYCICGAYVYDVDGLGVLHHNDGMHVCVFVDGRSVSGGVTCDYLQQSMIDFEDRNRFGWNSVWIRKNIGLKLEIS